MALDPELEGIIGLVNSVEQQAPTEAGVGEMRTAFAGLVALFGTGSTAVSSEDVELPGAEGPIPARLYRPVTAEGLLSTLVWFHGGGWVIGDVDTHDALCRDVAEAAGCAVVSVGYRLAPEHRFPAAHDDCSAAVEHLLRSGAELGLDPSRMAVGGDSAGGHLATVTARRRRDRADSDLPPLRAQVLVYPVTDTAGSPVEHPSRAENAEGYLLTSQTMDFFTETYLPDPDQREHPDASPLRAEDLSGLPPALVIVAGFDPLRDEGLAYAERLESAGVPTTLEHLDGGVHLCAQMASTGIGRGVVARVGGYLRKQLTG